MVVDRRLVPVGESSRSGRGLLAPAVLAGQQAARERAPDQDPEALVDRERYQLVFGLAGLQPVGGICWLTNRGRPSLSAVPSAFISCQAA